ncbi:unnamed protein product [Arabidopsis halleri]
MIDPLTIRLYKFVDGVYFPLLLRLFQGGTIASMF